MKTLMIAAAALSLATAATAQSTDSACTFARCGYGIMPRLTGLDVVRGTSEAPVASLPFLWSKQVAGAFSSDSAAAAHARRATSLRTAGALLSNAGAALVTAAIVTGIRAEQSRRLPVALGVGGLAALGASVPVHFAADAELSRAVWFYNAHLETLARGTSDRY